MKLRNTTIILLLFFSSILYSQKNENRVIFDTLYNSKVYIPTELDKKSTNLIYRFYILNDAIKNKKFPDKNELSGSDEFNSLIFTWNKDNEKIAKIINVNDAKDLEILIFEYRQFIK